jgi:transcriptional regulator with XRE-family HTH domain
MISSDQLRAARALKGLSQSSLAELVGVSTKTIKRAEGSGVPSPAVETVNSIRLVLEKLGVEFIPENGGGAGVRLKGKTKDV